MEASCHDPELCGGILYDVRFDLAGGCPKQDVLLRKGRAYAFRRLLSLF